MLIVAVDHRAEGVSGGVLRGPRTEVEGSLPGAASRNRSSHQHLQASEPPGCRRQRERCSYPGLGPGVDVSGFIL